MKKIQQPFKQIQQCFSSGYYAIGAVITMTMLSLPVFADHPSGDPFAKDMGIDLKSSDNAGDAFGKFVTNILWWVGLAVMAISFIGAIMMIMHILNMSREEKDHHGTIGKWAIVLISVVLTIALGAVLFGGLGQVQ